MKKTITLGGRKWLVRHDSYRFYVAPAEGNPLIDRDEWPCLEFKHDSVPQVNELVEKMFAALPDEALPVEPKADWRIGPDTSAPGCKCIVSGNLVNSANCPIHGLPQNPSEPKAPQCGATVGETSGFSAAECALPAGHPGAHQWQPLNRGGD